ncbi:MAG: 6-phosphogluconate dehydrogenase [Bacteroidia bacterium]
MSIIKKILLWIIGLTITGLVLAVVFALYANFSSGYRVGRIIKVSEKGYVFKTNEGQLNTGGFSEGDGDMTSSIWKFSVKKGDQEILDQLKDANKEMVRLYYDEKFVKIPFLGDTKYFVTKVEIVE